MRRIRQLKFGFSVVYKFMQPPKNLGIISAASMRHIWVFDGLPNVSNLHQQVNVNAVGNLIRAATPMIWMRYSIKFTSSALATHRGRGALPVYASLLAMYRRSTSEFSSQRS